MPLDNRKAAHIQQMVNKSFTGRQRNIVLVTNTAGNYSYSAMAVVFRPDLAVDPQIPNQSGMPPHAQAELVLIAPLGTNLTGVVFIADRDHSSRAGCAQVRDYHQRSRRHHPRRHASTCLPAPLQIELWVCWRRLASNAP
ncbi:hypothetical protein KSC_013210 [Ktedonobacter sp. SOSP1-52]|uniref:hypothetical protein n=1 Tax=Ktedonobacter sp. SOSP1-52 TaxID=2778366 RepID=UPI0019164FBF|nr:hypothetical protein [Ktedonobacter sp. SOSP1-52]GHO62429.1 hypothetical protein KSC_013210 [Ktedonobacter sp. SOSP1-52]